MKFPYTHDDIRAVFTLVVWRMTVETDKTHKEAIFILIIIYNQKSAIGKNLPSLARKPIF